MGGDQDRFLTVEGGTQETRHLLQQQFARLVGQTLMSELGSVLDGHDAHTIDGGPRLRPGRRSSFTCASFMFPFPGYRSCKGEPEQPAGRDRAPQPRLEAEAVLDHEVREVVGQHADVELVVSAAVELDEHAIEACNTDRYRRPSGLKNSISVGTAPVVPSPVVFVLLLTYTKPLDEVDALMRRHMAWLNKHRAAGRFVTWGRQIPRTGGVILAHGDDRDEMEASRRATCCDRRGRDVQVIEFRAAHQI